MSITNQTQTWHKQINKLNDWTIVHDQLGTLILKEAKQLDENPWTITFCHKLVSFKYQSQDKWWWSNTRNCSCQCGTTNWKCTDTKIVRLKSHDLCRGHGTCFWSFSKLLHSSSRTGAHFVQSWNYCHFLDILISLLKKNLLLLSIFLKTVFSRLQKFKVKLDRKWKRGEPQPVDSERQKTTL